MFPQEDYTTDEEALAAHGVKGGAGGILDLLKASKQVAGLDSAALRFVGLGIDVLFLFLLIVVYVFMLTELLWTVYIFAF